MRIVIVARRRLHIDFFIVVKFAIEKRAYEIETFYVPIVARRYGKNEANAGKPGDWRIGIKIIQAIYLGESSGYEACFVLVNAAIGVALDVEDPFAADNIHIVWT